MIDKLNSISINIPGISIPSFSFSTSLFGHPIGFSMGPFDVWGGMEISPPDISSIPMLAEGGIVEDPMLGILGERGPEAVIPLDQGANRLQSTIIIELDGRTLARGLVPFIPGVVRVSGVTSG